MDETLSADSLPLASAPPCQPPSRPGPLPTPANTHRPDPFLSSQMNWKMPIGGAVAHDESNPDGQPSSYPAVRQIETWIHISSNLTQWKYRGEREK